MEEIFKYNLPESFIAKRPASPRDRSKLLIYHVASGEISIDRFSNLQKYLPPDSFLVMNESRVLPVRLNLKRANGEGLELLILLGECDYKNSIIRAIGTWKLFHGEIIKISEKYSLEVLDTRTKVFEFRPNFPMHKFSAILRKFGTTPIPKYIAGSNLTEADLRKKYQTVFAKNPGSAAAPTASLHFTPHLLKKIPHAFVTLHVGLGTFAPVLPEHRASGKFYEETYEIPEETFKKLSLRNKALKNSRSQGDPVLVAVGTTVVRTLETFARTKVRAGKSDLFIRPPFEFKSVDSLITNFHLPGSSLMMLVEAFLMSKDSKHHLKELYEFAIKHDFRFYSFGDAMLIV